VYPSVYEGVHDVSYLPSIDSGTSRMRIKAQPIMLEEQLLDQHGFYFNMVFAIVPSG
jgi:hypothetical protein